MSDNNKGRQDGWKIGGLVGMERVYKKVLFEQEVSKNILDRGNSRYRSCEVGV